MKPAHSNARRWLVGLMLLTGIVFGESATVAAEDAAAEAEAVGLPDDALALASTEGLLAAKLPGHFLGSRSCAAAACHGSVEPDPRFSLSRRNEFTTWLERDPHAQGFRTLGSERSRQMLERLGIARDGRTLDVAGLANCHACHNPQPAVERRGATYFVRDGVSCETCHGPAERWIGTHYQPGWVRLPDSGMVDTADVRVRARLCAECHVGSPGREVNHDLIAAGHPPLRFELAAYHDALPKHWREGAERAGGQFELRLWSAGQVASADCAVRLLQWRATRAAAGKPGAVWPELAEYDCYACHHDLMHPSWRQQAAASERPLGMAPWGTWYIGMLRRMAAAREASSDAARDARPRVPPQVAASLNDLADVMQQGFFVAPGEVAAPAAQAVEALGAWSAAGSSPAADQLLLGRSWRDALSALAHGEPTTAPETWDEATQQYLLLAAIEQARLDGAGESRPAVDRALERVRGQLQFPADHDGPDESPALPATRRQIRDALDQLVRELRAVEE